VSQENVEIVLSVQPGPDVDLAEQFRDDTLWAAAVEALAPFTHPEFECALRGGPGGDPVYAGTDGLRQMFLDWLAPWAAYRTEIEETIDCGDQVLVLANTFGQLAGSTQQVRQTTSDVWTVRDGKIVRFEGYARRSEALKAVGLEE
jgi:ketosteroid isomerase-like protein